MEKILIKKGKELSYLLRHDKKAFEAGWIDENGWRYISELIINHGYTKELLEAIIISNDKKRYEYNEDKTKIRARQGHSIPVDVELKEQTPPDVLYHGTAERFLNSIYKEGIIKKNRLYVHLSDNQETALKVGSRYGKPFVLKIDCKQMVKDGIKFYLSNNGVWLTDFVDNKYIK